MYMYISVNNHFQMEMVVNIHVSVSAGTRVGWTTHACMSTTMYRGYKRLHKNSDFLIVTISVGLAQVQPNYRQLYQKQKSTKCPIAV